ncbi:hypothetical protein C1H76_7102 [Elsinoe australis]|uniref:Uncharacterized protein n=1 Tax=Elsinoe australis TaxID=40998 RepID=A0A4U7AW56_9PEZI|nr:hypothetical protein C1H76_7102 [Elsinoe australis]
MVFKSLVVASVLSVTFAQQLKRQTDISQSGCNGIIGDYYGKVYCCPGVAYNDTDEYPSGSGYCCVGAVFPIPGGRFSDCFPNCNPTASGASPTSSEVNILPITETQSCRTTIMFTDSQYTSKANAYNAGITGPLTLNTESAITTTRLSRGPTDDTGNGTMSEISSTAASTTGGTTALSGTRTQGSSATTGFSGPAITGSTSTSNSAGSQSTGTSASSALGGRITSGPLAGAFMIAGGILAAAL